jgi:poly-gamma-glutamate synthesis protein (capsule biosynthesis protein)
VSNEAKSKTKAADRYATPLLDPAAIRADIASARRAGADVVIVLPHWGTRNSLKVDPAQRQMAEQLVGMGADLVLGAHPNVVQRVERVSAAGQDGKQREALVAYSLGSLLSDGRELPNASSIMLHIDLQVDVSTHAARLVRFGYVPLWVLREKQSGSNNYVYRILRADDEDNVKAAGNVVKKRLEDACLTVQKALGEGVEVPVYWP